MRQLYLLIFGLIGAALLSQAPEFAQQYRQNLDGRVDELARIQTLDDRDAARRDRLAEHERNLDAAGPFMRLVELASAADSEVANATFARFEPAVPVTVEGAAHAGAGFLVGRFVGILALFGLGALGLRRRDARA